jgi:hypothetical protein
MNAGEPKLETADREAKSERDLFRIMTLSTALGFGALAAFLFSLKDIENDVSFVFSTGTVIAFVLGAAVGWAFWRGVGYLIRKKGKGG